MTDKDPGRESLDETMQAMVEGAWRPSAFDGSKAQLIDGRHTARRPFLVGPDTLAVQMPSGQYMYAELLPTGMADVTHSELCRETIATGHPDLRFRLSVMPGMGAKRQPDDSWAWPPGEACVDLHLTPVYAFTELLFARVSRFVVAYDPARGVLEQFGELVGKMREESAANWLGPAVAVLARETGFRVE